MFCRVICNYAQPIKAPTGAIQIDLRHLHKKQTDLFCICCCDAYFSSYLGHLLR